MPLYPPPQLVEHPADLVIDMFGTFLGKRSERMVIRWRDVATKPVPAECSNTHTLAEGQACGAISNAQASPSADVLPEIAANTSESAADEMSEESSSKQDMGGLRILAFPEGESDGAAPAAPVRKLPSPLEGEGLAMGGTSHQGRDIAPSTPAHLPSTETPAVPQGESPARTRAAERIASQLIGVWARGGRVEKSNRPAPRSQLKQQLDAIADQRAADRPAGEWTERTVPMSRLRSVTVSGRGVTVSSDLIAALVERGIGLSFLTGRGVPVAHLSAPGLGGTVQTRRSQLAAYHTSVGVRLAVEFIRGKLRNQKHQLKYSGKYLKASEPARFERLKKKIAAIDNLRRQLLDFAAEDLDTVRDKLMGYEGTGARVYWEGVAIVLEGRVEFSGRQTRGAIDPVNSALNYGYGILYSQVSAAVVNAGLEMYAGFLHVDRPGKPALVLDLVEEFRAPIVDRTVLAIVNQGTPLEADAHGLTAAARKLVADRVLERLATAVPYEGKRWPLGTIIQNQARHLAVAVRGERVYRSFASRW